MTNINTISTNSRNVRSISLNILFVASILAMGIADVSFARGGGRGGGGGFSGGGGGRMASSSVSSSNRGMSGGGYNQGRPSGGNNNINSGNNNNVNIDRNTNVNIDGGYNNGYHGGGYNNNCCYHGGVRYPVAAGITIGAMAVTRAAVIGSYYYALPPSCTTVYRANVKYYYCGSVYYQQSWSGNDVVYIVVNP